MRGKLVVCAAMAILAGAAGLSQAAGPTHPPTAHISVRPGTGSPTTSFVVSFRAPVRTGSNGTSKRQYILSAWGSLGTTGCAANIDEALPYSRLHAHVHVKLSPARLGGRWCAGTFNGQIEEIQAPVCPHGQACPAFVLLLGTIGKFTFHVKSTGGDTTPPTFAGLQRSSACTPGPQRPGQTTPFGLSWTAATDDVTRSSQIVYDIFMSSTSGGEDFSKPSWTTAPGATMYETPGLPSHGAFFFVVRARDQAGNEDQNRVERRGIDPCV
jgi:hypothetical protein